VLQRCPPGGEGANIVPPSAVDASWPPLGNGIGCPGGHIGAKANADGLTTSSPEVQAAVERGIKYLESDAANDGRIGARALVALSLLKHDGKRDHPKIVEAASKIRQALGGHDLTGVDKASFGDNKDAYELGLAIIFLAELDPAQYRPDIECMLRYLCGQQKPHGAWAI